MLRDSSAIGDAGVAWLLTFLKIDLS